ncbi:hypothetical protein ACFO0N_06290 [Halobium salinum]|uniref:Uncharacterized protein n=1 Tax=Halobium salinum TaxID=1364940 RepID=A0ABD5PA08_9EURY|nr:hypothetical protein [Halobium salinum]
MTALDTPSFGVVVGLGLVVAGELVGFLDLSLVGVALFAVSLLSLVVLSTVDLLVATRRETGTSDGMLARAPRPR